GHADAARRSPSVPRLSGRGAVCVDVQAAPSLGADAGGAPGGVLRLRRGAVRARAAGGPPSRPRPRRAAPRARAAQCGVAGRGGAWGRPRARARPRRAGGEPLRVHGQLNVVWLAGVVLAVALLSAPWREMAIVALARLSLGLSPRPNRRGN